MLGEKEKALKKIIAIVLFLCVAVGALYVWLVLPLDWKIEGKYVSPDGSLVAYHVQSRSEVGEAPYGDHVVIAPRWVPFAQYMSDPVFAGYCTKGPTISWKGEKSLSIECEPEEVITQLSKYGEVMVDYDLQR